MQKFSVKVTQTKMEGCEHTVKRGLGWVKLMLSVLRTRDLSVTGFASFLGLISYHSIFLNALQNAKIERKTNTNSQMQ